MPFQPFGRHFSFTTARSPADIKARLRARKKPWLELKEGARGWIVGPLVCLRLGILAGPGPLLLGWISGTDAGTKISGQAGFNLGGIVLFLVIAPIAGLLFSFSGHGIIITATCLSAAILVLLTSLAFHKDAEPLIRFVRTAIDEERPRIRRPLQNVAIDDAISMNLSGKSVEGLLTGERIRTALQSLDTDGFVILSSSDEVYLQAVMTVDRFRIEKREGDALHHFGAVRAHEGPSDERTVFDADELLMVCIAYASRTPLPSFLKWEPMRI